MNIVLRFFTMSKQRHQSGINFLNYDKFLDKIKTRVIILIIVFNAFIHPCQQSHQDLYYNRHHKLRHREYSIKVKEEELPESREILLGSKYRSPLPTPSLQLSLRLLGDEGGQHSRAVDRGNDNKCTVQPPCFCINKPSADKQEGRKRVQRIKCEGGFMRKRRRFPRFVENGDPVDYLSMSYTGLTVIPNSAFRGVKVAELDLQGNDFADRVGPRAFSGISRSLQSINLAWSNITQLPRRVFKGLVVLRNMSLAENRLVKLSSYIFDDLRELHKLSIAGNNLTNLPPSIFRHQANLETLDLGYCFLTTIPRNLFSGLWNLKVLDLRGNRISQLEPFSFANLYFLETLLLSQNPVTTLLSKVFYGLVNLKDLRVEESLLNEISEDAFTELAKLVTLDLGDNQLEHLQEDTLKIDTLENLSLDGNQLKEVPREIGNLKSLKSLDLSYNKLETISECLFLNLKYLEYLNIRENPFKCDCKIFWLRQFQSDLVNKWSERRARIPFVSGNCFSPDSLRGNPVTQWLDLECRRTVESKSNLLSLC